MRRLQTVLILCVLLAAFGCGGAEEKPATPVDALKAYTRAIKKKDAARMRELLSKGSLKMADDEAKSQKVATEEILQRETLFSEGQKTFKFRNEKIEGDKASIEFEDAFGNWDTVFFVREDGAWKIAKERYAEEMIKKSEERMRKLDEEINQE
jgi:uncharacterized protein YeaO (DUF488 family)